MASETPVDQAFGRYTVLSRLIAMELERARANPQDRRYHALGITDVGDTKQDAVQKVVETFDSLANLLEHVAVLDMAGSFERLFRARIGNTVGDARKSLAQQAKQGRASELAPKLVRDVEEFRGLRDIETLIETVLSRQVVEALMLIRDGRNKFAHGTNLSVHPAIEPTQVRDNLNEIAARI